jgi:hypothetical protein
MIKVRRAPGSWSRPRREGRELTELFSNSDITRPSPSCPYTLWWNEQIWSVKKTEEAAAKKRPKMSAAQLRVQKGEFGLQRRFLPFAMEVG